MTRKDRASGRPAARPAVRKRVNPDDVHEHGHAAFRLSKRTSDLVSRALRPLPGARRTQVLDALGVVAEEAREQGERFVERNVIGNANELLAAMTESLAAGDRWSELRALWVFLAHLDVPVKHARIARRLEKTLGKDVAEGYREAVRASREQSV